MMKESVLKAIIWLTSSLDTHSKGSSARKLTAFGFMLLITWLHKYECNGANVDMFYYGDCIMLLLMLSIITGEQLIKLKNGNEKNNIDNTGNNNA